jgi:hypothetical protein
VGKGEDSDVHVPPKHDSRGTKSKLSYPGGMYNGSIISALVIARQVNAVRASTNTK